MGSWHSGIARNTQNLKVLSLNPTDSLSRGGLLDKAPGNLQVRHIECVPLTIFFHLDIFSASLKFLGCYIMGQWAEFTVKNGVVFTYIFWTFFVHQNICVFIIFFFLKYQISATKYQSEAGIGDQKLSVELYV